ELYILYDEIEKYLSENKISVYKVFVGNYVTSLDMNGTALTIMKLDDELKMLLDYEAESKGIEIH
ncbi:MAG: dihydroxyacetone kinase subunit DhaK, partial [Clostridium celatum]|nr:dihydroxyacetone kinase subunit DhaK [Clostridium celatum]